MAENLINSLLSLATNLLPIIRATSQVSSSSLSNNNSERGISVEETLDKMKRTLERIKATLYDAEEREVRDRSVKLWLKELKKVAYDAEDVLGEYRYEATRVQVEAKKASDTSGSNERKQMEYMVPIPDGMVDRLNKIRSRFDEIAKDREALQLRDSDGVRRPNYRTLQPPTGHMVDEVEIFGRDADVMEVIDLLLSREANSFSVISIVGKGGLGKTTIAQLVYNNESLSHCFDLIGWVCVSEEFEVRRLTKATIESVSEINYGVSELSPLQKELSKTVKGKRILLVLDDLWNENQSLWELFRIPFKEAQLVRILVTTRNEKVAEVVQTTAYFRPTYLHEDPCWQLFKHYAFCSTSYTIPTHFEEMGMKIMKKCGGLPLAVKSIASLLRHETDEESWGEILESDLWQSNPSNDVFSALQISYAHLPTHLKPCFLFCSMFPKDYEISKSNLIELWISNGYIKSRSKKRITIVGVEYYEELRERSLIDEYSEHCKLHDIIHDLARLNSENEHFSVEINQPPDILEENIPQETHHLYARGFVGYVNQFLQKKLKGIRTLSTDLRVCRGVLEHQYCINNIEAMNLSGTPYCINKNSIFNLSKFEELSAEILDSITLDEYGLAEIPDSITLDEYGLAEIPDSIIDLRVCRGVSEHQYCINDIEAMNLSGAPYCINQNSIFNLTTFEALRVLELDEYCLAEIPDSITNLKHLAHLRISSSYLKMLPQSIGLLYNLQTLILDCWHSPLKNLPKNIGDLANLQCLHMQCDNLQELPKSLCSLTNLLRLVIRCNVLNEVPSDVGRLLNLQELTISSSRISTLPDSMGCLSCLEELELSLIRLDNLPGWVGHYQKLKILQIPRHPINFIPYGLVNFPAIKKLVGLFIVKTIAWLKDMKGLEGELTIKGLENMSNVEYAQHANLRSKSKIETLDLSWNYKHWVRQDTQDESFIEEKTTIRIIKETLFYSGKLVGADINFCLLECLQPHPNLKELCVRGYPSTTVPSWMGDPFALQSIKEIRLLDCHNLQSLPFSNLHTLKHLSIDTCSSIRLLQLEKLPSQLEVLLITNCRKLETITGLRYLGMLAGLSISDCLEFKLLTMDELQLAESTKPFGVSSHNKPHIGQQSISSLVELKIGCCPLLCVLPDGLITSGLYYVWVNACGCPDIKIGGNRQIKFLRSLLLLPEETFKGPFLDPR